MKIAFGCDPNASDLKQRLMAVAASLGHDVTDLGSTDPIYAGVAADVARSVAAGEADRGVVVCGTGIGVSIAANKVPGAYCALVTDVYQAKRAQLSNNANLIAFGAQVTGVELAQELLSTYLDTQYEEGSRSAPKVAAITALESQA